MFQSPCGDLVSGKRCFSTSVGNSDRVEFQSPCGDLVSGKSTVTAVAPRGDGFQSPCGDLVSGKL